MRAILPLRNPIRHYAWGSRSAIAELQGRPVPSPEPEAELWMGTHPQGPSEVFHEGRWRPLDGDLPFLFKVLAAGEPLSIQAHPDAEQARRGFEREEAAGIPRDAGHRNYRDPHPKPEILYALTPFAMVRGFRKPAATLELLDRLEIADLLPESRALRAASERAALEEFFTAWMTRDPADVTAVVEAVVAKCAGRSREEPAFRWVPELAARYPGDRGVLAPLFLNVAELRPGQAVFTGPGILHAYLEGVGIELMTCSDNVLRGGLTPKHVDVPELLDVLRFEPVPISICVPEATTYGRRFEEDGLCLDVVEIRPDQKDVRLPGGRPLLLLCVEGRGTLAGGGCEMQFSRGDSFFVAARVESLCIRGPATLFAASSAADGLERIERNPDD